MNRLTDKKTTSPPQRTGLDRLCRSGRARQDTYTSESRRNSLQRSSFLRKEESGESSSSSTSSSTQLSIFASLNRDDSRTSTIEDSGPDTRQTSIASDEHNDKESRSSSSSRKRSFDETDDNPSLLDQPQQSRKQRRTSSEERDLIKNGVDSSYKRQASSDVQLDVQRNGSSIQKTDQGTGMAQQTTVSSPRSSVSTAHRMVAEKDGKTDMHEMRRDSTRPLHDTHSRRTNAF